MDPLSNQTVLAVLAYIVTVLLIFGGLFCLYVSLRMISKRAQASGSSTRFEMSFGSYRVTIGTGSLAALVLSISVLWAVVALLSRPRLEFTAQGGGKFSSVLTSISSITTRNTANHASADVALLRANRDLLEANAAILAASTSGMAAASANAAQTDAAVEAAADAAEAAADSAEAAADSAEAATDSADAG